ALVFPAFLLELAMAAFIMFSISLSILWASCCFCFICDAYLFMFFLMVFIMLWCCALSFSNDFCSSLFSAISCCFSSFCFASSLLVCCNSAVLVFMASPCCFWWYEYCFIYCKRL